MRQQHRHEKAKGRKQCVSVQKRCDMSISIVQSVRQSITAAIVNKKSRIIEPLQCKNTATPFIISSHIAFLTTALFLILIPIIDRRREERRIGM